MSAYIVDWLNLLIRWLHVITGIAWIGSSFYFVWLDTHLQTPPPEKVRKGIGGDLWAVHGGGFYEIQKYKVAPEKLPETLHWFKWEAYFTWISGFLLLNVLYYVNASAYLIDKSVADISPAEAIAIGIGTLVLGWLVYDTMCRLFKDNDRLLAVLGCVLLIAAAYGLTHVFSGRGAYIHVGALIGTIMAANVFFVIIPGQKGMVKAKEEGREPDPMLGIRGKQRSMHNNYLTLPLVFLMISNHYPMTYGARYNWLVLAVFIFAGMLIRHFFNLRNKGKIVPAVPAAALVLLAALAFAIAPRQAAMPEAHATAAQSVSFDQVHAIIQQRCEVCHSAHPTQPGFATAPQGIKFDTPDEIKSLAGRIHEQAVVAKTMPLGNLTGMTEDERRQIGAWYAQHTSD